MLTANEALSNSIEFHRSKDDLAIQNLMIDKMYLNTLIKESSSKGNTDVQVAISKLKSSKKDIYLYLTLLGYSIRESALYTSYRSYEKMIEISWGHLSLNYLCVID